MNLKHIYDISFVPPQGSKEINPHIVFSMDEQYLEELQEKLCIITERLKEYKDEYFGTDLEFTPLSKDVFGNYTFGCGRCGYMYIDNKVIYIHFELTLNVDIHHISMTMFLLLKVLNFFVYDEEIENPNNIQFLQLDTVCQIGHHGHSISGSVSPKLGAWLKKQGECLEDESAFSNVSLLDVEKTMRQTWNQFTERKLEESPRECRAIIVRSGRFSLVCPGDACDVSIYPDQVYGDEIGTMSVRFACHNLDVAKQQITLVAGLAKLCELARKDT